MERTLKILTVVSVLGFALVLSNSFAAAPQAFPPNGTPGEGGPVCGYYLPGSWSPFEASWLIGHRVHSPTGGDLGQISDVIIDRSDGHVVFVILSDIPGFEDRFIAAPFGALERIGENVFILSFGGRKIAGNGCSEDPYVYDLKRHVMTVGLNDIPQAIDFDWANGVYKYFGQTPNWVKGKEAPREILSYQATKLMGAAVRSKDGQVTARMQDLILDSRDGLAGFSIFDRVPGKGDAMVAVPFGELSMAGSAFVLNTTGDKLTKAPSFYEETDLHNIKWARDLYKFFGMQICWNEE